MFKLLFATAIVLAACGGTHASPPATQDTTRDHPPRDGGTPMMPKSGPVPALDPTTVPAGPKTDL
ncbi:hypothetical protein BH11MYX1_BH11MYX1_38920 [soil metagenome]